MTFAKMKGCSGCEWMVAQSGHSASAQVSFLSILSIKSNDPTPAQMGRRSLRPPMPMVTLRSGT